MTIEELIKNLQNPAAYSHPVENFQVIETHVSFVILTGSYAYKIKKPVDFEFLNYSTLEQRNFYCHEEVRLNQLLSPELYLGVVTINGTLESPHIEGAGPIIEYAVKMRQFSAGSLFTDLLARQQLTPTLVEQLARLIAEFHQRTPAASADTPFGTPDHIYAPVIQNFSQITPLLTDSADLQSLQQLQQWSEQQFQQHHTLFAERKNKGFIRDCHGDLHLGNIILYQQKPALFDRIEFNEDFRWTDVMADVGFITMDFDDQQQPAYAHSLLNTYLALTGDYAGLAILPFYQAYRAIVRAKIALFTLHHGQHSASEQQALWQKYRKLIALAQHYAKPKIPQLWITHGLSGSGKSKVSNLLVEQFGFIQIRSDIERKKLHDLAADAKTQSALYAGIYEPVITEKVYAHLAKMARVIIKAGYSVIVDATFLKFAQRQLFQDLAKQLNVPFKILSCQAPHAELVARIQQRQAELQEPSEARLDILVAQEQIVEMLTEQEMQHNLTIDTLKITPVSLLDKFVSLLTKPT